MKVFVDIREDEAAGRARYQLAITLPAKWLQLPSDKLLDTYVSTYNKKHADAPLERAEWQLCIKDVSPFARSPWKVLAGDAIMGEVFTERQEVWLVPLSSTAGTDGTGAGAALPTCKNYGCQKKFREEENADDACCHHVGAPVFHDTRKWWSCCEEQKVYDFDALFAVPGCARGRHSTTPPAATAEADESVKEQAARVAERLMQAQAAPKPSAAPDISPAAPPPPKPKAPPKLPPGMARCRHYGARAHATHASSGVVPRVRALARAACALPVPGVTSAPGHPSRTRPSSRSPAGCQRDYRLDENGPSACTHHAQAPVFHDGGKRWPCCNQSRWDFDDFISVPGCATGPHEPVE